MKILRNTYKSQRKNKYQPNSTCNVTALSNGLECIGIKVSPDELYLKANSPKYISWSRKIGSWVGEYVARKKLNQVWAVLEHLADEYIGNEDGGQFRDNWLEFSDIIDYIKNGCPVIVGGNFTHGGHLVCIIGYYDDGFIVDDSWGDWNTQYKNTNGDNRKYKYADMEKVLHGKNGKYRALVLKK